MQKLTERSDSDNFTEHTISKSILSHYLKLVRGTRWQPVNRNLSAARGCHRNSGPVWHTTFPVPEITRDKRLNTSWSTHTFQMRSLCSFCMPYLLWCLLLQIKEKYRWKCTAIRDLHLQSGSNKYSHLFHNSSQWRKNDSEAFLKTPNYYKHHSCQKF